MDWKKKIFPYNQIGRRCFAKAHCLSLLPSVKPIRRQSGINLTNMPPMQGASSNSRASTFCFDLCISLLFQIHQWGVTLKQESEAFSEEPAGALNGNTSEQKNAPFRPFGDSIRDIISTNLASTGQKRLLGYAWAAQDLLYGRIIPTAPFSDLVQLKAWNITDKDMFPKKHHIDDRKGQPTHQSQACCSRIKPDF